MSTLVDEFKDNIEVRYDSLIGVYWAYIQDIPQCSSHGSTVELAMEAAKEKLEYIVEMKKVMNQYN